jgi:lipopolysaccharide/colanic/teichoic acid biosynthesis glycosyltransferase
MTKRLFDLVIAVLLLPVVGPLMVAVAAALKLGGRVAAVMWRSPRLGRGGRPFELLSFARRRDQWSVARKSMEGRRPTGRRRKGGSVCARGCRWRTTGS